VLYSYGDQLPRRNDAMSKAADSLVVRFMKRVDQTMLNECCDRTEAMRKARKENEREFADFQLV
jgi:hypothetical protein